MAEALISPSVTGTRRIMDAFSQGAISGRIPSRRYIDDLIQAELDFAATNAYRNQALIDQRKRDELAQQNFETNQRNAAETAEATRKSSTMGALTNLGSTALLFYAMKPSPAPGSAPPTTTPTEPGIVSRSMDQAGSALRTGFNTVKNWVTPGVTGAVAYPESAYPSMMTPPAEIAPSFSQGSLLTDPTLSATSLPSTPTFNPGPSITQATPSFSTEALPAVDSSLSVTGMSEAPISTIPMDTSLSLAEGGIQSTAVPSATGVSTAGSTLNTQPLVTNEALAATEAAPATGTAGPTFGGAATAVGYVALANMVRNQWGQLDKAYGERSPWAKFTSAPVTGGPAALMEAVGMGESNYFAKGANRLARGEEELVGEPLDKMFQGDIMGGLESFGKGIMNTPRNAWNASIGAATGGLLDTWLCTQVNRFVGLTDDQNQMLQDLRRFSIKNHRPWIRFYLDHGKNLIEEIREVIPSKMKRREFYSALKANMVLPVLNLVANHRMEEAFILYKEYTTDLFKKFAPDFVKLSPQAV